MPEVDRELVTLLKDTKPKFFAFIPQGALGQLIVCKSKSDRDKIAAATKKQGGGGTLVKGTCSGPINKKVFEVAKAPANLAVALKNVVKRDAGGLTIVPDVQVAGEEED